MRQDEQCSNRKCISLWLVINEYIGCDILNTCKETKNMSDEFWYNANNEFMALLAV